MYSMLSPMPQFAAGTLRGMWNSTPLRWPQAWRLQADERCGLCTPRAPGPHRRALCVLRAAAAPSLAHEQAHAAPAARPAAAARSALAQEGSAATPATSRQAVGESVPPPQPTRAAPQQQPPERKQQARPAASRGQAPSEPRQQPGTRRCHTTPSCLPASCSFQGAGLRLNGCNSQALSAWLAGARGA